MFGFRMRTFAILGSAFVSALMGQLHFTANHFVRFRIFERRSNIRILLLPAKTPFIENDRIVCETECKKVKGSSRKFAKEGRIQSRESSFDSHLFNLS